MNGIYRQECYLRGSLIGWREDREALLNIMFN